MTRMPRAVKTIGVCFFGFLVLTSCGNGTDSVLVGRIEFEMNGTEYSFTQGYNNINGPAEGSFRPDVYPITYIAGVPATAENNVDEYVMFWFFSIPRTGQKTHVDIEISLKIGGEILDEIGDDFTVTVHEFGDTGGMIIGEFEGTVKNAAESLEYSISEGYFEVVRIGDNQLTFP